MQTIAIIGSGAIGEAVARYLDNEPDVLLSAAIITPGMDERARDVFGPDVETAYEFSDLSGPVDLVIDCAGHAALRQHGAAVLASGTNLVSVSSGALAAAARLS